MNKKGAIFYASQCIMCTPTSVQHFKVKTVLIRIEMTHRHSRGGKERSRQRDIHLCWHHSSH